MHALNHVQVKPRHVAMHWFGQSSYAVKDPKGTVVLIDPYFPRERSLDRYVQPVPPVNEADLKTDFVLLTHHHRDHTCLETTERVARAWPDARFVGPQESIDAIVENGIDASRTVVIEAGGSERLGSMTVHALYAKPPEGDPENDIEEPDVTHLGFVLDTGDVRLYFSGDPINTFAQRDDLIEPIKRLQPHIGMLTTHPSEGEFPFFDGSAAMAKKIGLQTAVPAHYACFVRRDYDPRDWAAHFGDDHPETLIIPYNGMVVYSPDAS